MSDKKAIRNFRKLLSETKQLAKEKEKRILKEEFKPYHKEEPELDEKITNFNLKNKLKQAGSAIKNKITGSTSAQSQVAPNPAAQPVEKSAEVIKEPELPNATELTQTIQQFITKAEQFFSQVKDKVRMGQQSYTLKETTEGDPEFSNWADRFSDPVDNIFDSIQMRIRGLKKDLKQLNSEISKAK